MGVYIKGMKMPTSCTRCRCCKGCPAVNTRIAQMAEEAWFPSDHRHPDCPLVPVPPHGRLGDLDALKVKAIERSEKCGVCVNVLDKVITAYDIETAPTIIPEDKED